MSRRIDITGQQFGRWLAKEYVGVDENTRRSLWKCLCNCGKEGVVNSLDLRKGHSKSCGCLGVDMIRERSRKKDSGFNKLLRQYRSSAKHRNLVFELSKEDFQNLTEQRCYYCGQLPIAVSIKLSVGGAYVYNGIDRKNNSLGYTKENSVPCCRACNFLKKDMDYFEFIRRVSAIHRQQNGVLNRLSNCKNPYQGKFKRVLVTCSAGLLRSPTVSFVLSNEPYNFNTRAVGLDVGHALIPLDCVLLEWADEIVCMDDYQESVLKKVTNKPVINLRISDNFEYRDKGLITIIKMRAREIWGKKNYEKTKETPFNK